MHGMQELAAAQKLTQAKTNEAPTQLQSFLAGSTGRLENSVARVGTLIERQQRQLHRISGVPVGGEELRKGTIGSGELGYIGHPPASDAIHILMGRLEDLDDQLTKLEELQNQSAAFA